MELFSILLTILISATCHVLAATPEGFEPQVDAMMELQFGDKYLAAPGGEMYIEGTLFSDCAEKPIIGRDAEVKETYFWMLIDMDHTMTRVHRLATALRDFEWIPFPPSQPQPDPNFPRIATSAVLPVPYSPLLNSSTGTPPDMGFDHSHRFVSLLFVQPEGLDWEIPDAALEMLQQQEGGEGEVEQQSFDVVEFMEKAGLEEVLGANWFFVVG